jgi:hypothetical protein
MTGNPAALSAKFTICVGNALQSHHLRIKRRTEHVMRILRVFLRTTFTADDKAHQTADFIVDMDRIVEWIVAGLILRSRN